ncbi:hypothetical protein TCAL_09207, partial [Tigriopus californicus]
LFALFLAPLSIWLYFSPLSLHASPLFLKSKQFPRKTRLRREARCRSTQSTSLAPMTLSLSLVVPRYGTLTTKKKTFFCKLCSVVFEQGRKSLLWAHVETVKHKKNLQLNEEGRNPRQQMLNMSTVENKHSNFAQALCKDFVTANIPLTKVEHPSIVELIQEHVTAPSRRTMTRIMEQECQNLLAEIKTRLTGTSIFVAVDETTDRTGRAMCAILAGPLDGKFLQRPFLIDLADIVRANN